MNEKLNNMDDPGLKELRCGCLIEVEHELCHMVRRSCPRMVWLFDQVGEKDWIKQIKDHIYDGIMG